MLGLFAKQPVPGRVKTRLAAQTSPAWAAKVAAAFLGDLIERFADFPAERFIAFDPPEAEAYFRALALGRFRLVPQAGPDLGARMEAFFAGRLRDGAARIVLTGADSPLLPASLLEEAFEELERADLVLGPATDGGYYLVGCSERVPPIFRGVSWGTETVLKQTIDRLPESGWRLALLPPWYDVDTLADWYALQGHMAALRRAGAKPDAARTEELATGARTW